MARIGWRHLCAWLGIAAVVGCKSEPANPEELLAARSLGVGYLERNRLPEAEEQFKKLDRARAERPVRLREPRARRISRRAASLKRRRSFAERASSTPRTPTWAACSRSYTRSPTAAPTRARLLEELQRAQPRDPQGALRARHARCAGSDSSGVKAEAPIAGRLLVARAREPRRCDSSCSRCFVRRGESDSAVRQLEEIRRLPPEPPAEAKPLLAQSIDLLRWGKWRDARPVVDRFVQTMELTAPYQASLAEVKWFEDPLVGRPVLTFGPQSVIQLRSSGILQTDDSTRLHRRHGRCRVYPTLPQNRPAPRLTRPACPPRLPPATSTATAPTTFSLPSGRPPSGGS